VNEERRRALDQLVVAKGPRLRLRPRVREDGHDEYRWRSDPETARFDGRPVPNQTLQQFLDVFGYELAYGRNDREQFALDLLDGTHIGTVMLYNLGGDSAELGISLGEEAVRGQGLGREAVILMLQWAWNNRSMRTIYLHALQWNERAIRCFRSAGFGEVAAVYRDGQALVRMETRREWWLLWEMEGRFRLDAPPAAADSNETAAAVIGAGSQAG
jgi:RimJ/RimL family protein N-acetyltransferase